MSEAAPATSRSRRTPRASVARLADCLWIVLCGGLVAVALWPFQDTPFIDDWVYAWSVEHLLAGDGLRILDWSSQPNFAHVLWGALFCLLLGFSFVVLRVSTWVAALLALCAFYQLLRELGVQRREAFLGVAQLGLNPVFFMLAATFMTDVPFLAASLWASFAFVAALGRRSDGWLAAFAIFAAVASAVRVVAVVAPIAAVLTLLLQGGPWGRRAARIALAASPLAFLALLMLWSDTRTVHVADLSGIVGSPIFRRLYLGESLTRLPQLALKAVLCAAGTLGVALLPLSAALSGRRAARRALPVLALLLALVALAAVVDVGWPPALASSFIWTYGELGATESLVAGNPTPLVPAAIVGGATVLGLLSSALALGVTRRRLRAPESFLVWSLAGHVGLMAILWLFYDRYLLPLLPLLIALLLSGRPALHRAAFTALLAVFALVSVAGVRDHLAYNEALWKGVTMLRQLGVPDSEVDGGYVVDGWLHYARPEHAPRDIDGNAFYPWLTTPGGLLRYQVANEPLPGWQVVEPVPFERWIGRSGSIYVLERAPAP